MYIYNSKNNININIYDIYNSYFLYFLHINSFDLLSNDEKRSYSLS